MHSRVAAVVAALSVAACTNPMEPPRAEVSALVTKQSLTTSGTLELAIAVTVENTTVEPIYFDFCVTTLERRDASGIWESVGGISCLAIGCLNPLHCMVIIRPGESRESPLHFYAYGENSVVEPGSNYRLRLSIAVPARVSARARRVVDFPISVQSLTTNEFTLTAAPN